MTSIAGDPHAFDAFIGYEIPVELSPFSQAHAESKKSTLFDMDGLLDDNHQSQPHFELMEIHISLYTLSGISYQAKKSNDKRRKRLEKAGWRRKANGSSVAYPNDAHTSAGMSTREGGATLSTISESCATTTLWGFEMNPTLPPTTAIVSCTRNDLSSKTPMETFCPSLPLHRLSRGDPHKIRYNARWTADKCPTAEEATSPSFSILRMMNQQEFVPSTHIGDVSTYEHEQVDLCVFVGRGREMIPVGVVSFVITGDEETETILNLPIKKPAVGSALYERHFKTSKRKKNLKQSFDSDPDHIFALGHNAILRIGVRAFPQRNFIEAERRLAVSREKEERIFETVLHDIIDADLLDNLEEERSLIEDIVDAQKRQTDEDERSQTPADTVALEQHMPSQAPPEISAPLTTIMDTDFLWKEFHEVLQHETYQPDKKATQKQQRQQQQQKQTCKQELEEVTPSTPLALIKPSLFCNFSFFPSEGPSVPPTATTKDPAIPEQVVTVNQTRNRLHDADNHTLSLTMVSSVSESLGTDGGHSNCKFQSEMADI